MSTLQEFLSTIKTYTTCLGQGGFGIVLKGIDESDTPSAVKFLFPIDFSDRAKLRREYEITKDLQHENIVQIMGVEEKKLTSADIDQIFKDLPYNQRSSAAKNTYLERANHSRTIESICIKMELCGLNLRDWLNKKHQKNELHVQIRQTRIVQGMITGLTYLHTNKIIHRDLKPENIMFSRGRYQLPVKIGDFGHSRLIQSDHMTSNVGTQVYKAPEVSSGNYDQQADLYSLGLILWEVAHLIEAGKRANLFDKLVNDREENLVQDHPIMTGIKEIIIKLTKRKTADRTKNLGEIINTEAWEEALVHEVTRKGCKPLWGAITSNFRNLNVKTSEEFKLALDNARKCCTINLAEGEYSGCGFNLWENGVIIVGKGSGTVLKNDVNRGAVLIVFGSECTISGVTLSASYLSGIVLHGDMNTIKNVEIDSLGGKVGIEINGGHNTIDHVSMNNFGQGISVGLNSNGNTISNILGVDLRDGIRVKGSNNTLSEIKLEKRIRGKGGDGVWLYSNGSSNTISNLTCSGYFNPEKREFDLRIGSPNTTVKDSQCGSVRVLGKNSTLGNVDCGVLIQIQPYVNGINLVKCRGKKLQASDRASVIDCQFEEIVDNS